MKEEGRDLDLRYWGKALGDPLREPARRRWQGRQRRPPEAHTDQESKEGHAQTLKTSCEKKHENYYLY